MKSEIEQKIITGGFGLALCILSGVSVISYWSLTGLHPVTSWSNSILTVAIGNTLSLMLFGWVYFLLRRVSAKQRQLQQAVQESQQQLETLANHSPAAICLKDIQGRYLMLNRQLERLTGLNKTEIVGSTDYDIFPKEIADQFQASDQAALQAGQCLEQEQVLPDNYSFITSKCPLYDSTGQAYAIFSVSTNITDRKRAEQERDRFFNLSLDMLAIANFDGYFTHLNPAWEHTLGFTLEELKTQPFIEFIHPVDVEATQTEMEKLRIGTSVTQFENRYRCKDGSYKWLSWTSVAFLEEGLIYGVARDISERKQAEAALQKANEELEIRVEERTAYLRQVNDELLAEIVERWQVELALRNSESLYRTLVETIPHGIEEIDTTGIITFGNSALHRMLGYAGKELLGKRIWDLIPDSARLTCPGYLARLVQEQPPPTPYVGTALTKDSHVLDIQVDWDYKRDEQGRVTGFIAVVTDITERKQMEEALKCSEERFRVAIENSPTIVFTQDTELRYTWVYNSSSGGEAEMFVGKSDCELFAPEEAQQLTAIKRRVLTTGVGTRDEVFLTVEGEVRYYDLTVEPLRDRAEEIIGITCAATDITDIRARKQELQAIFEGTLEAIIILNDEGKYVEVNPAFCELLGMPPSQVFGRWIGDFVASSIDIEQEWRILLQQGKATGELCLRHVDGTLREVEYAAKASFLPGRHLAVLRDITERKQAQQKIHFQARLLDVVQQAAIATDLVGNIIYWNRYAEVLYGWSASEVLGRPAVDVTPTETSKEQAAEIMSRLQAGESWSGEFWVQRRDGTTFPVMIFDSPIYDEQGEYMGMISISVDITESKQAQEALRVSEERLRTALKAAHMGTWDWNILTGQITWFGRFEGVLDIAGGSFNSTSYESFIRTIHPEDSARVLQKVKHVFMTGEDYEEEFRIILPNGNIRWLASIGQVFYDEIGRPIRMTGLDVDITERKIAQEARRKTEKLYRTMTSNFPNGAVVLFDQDLRYTLAEGKGLGAVGLSKESMEGNTIAEVLPPETCEVIEPAYQAALDGRETVFETTYNDRIFLVQVLPVKNEQGEIFAGMSMLQDITESKRSEQALLEERNFVSAILDIAAALIVVCDRQGRFIRVNRACEQTTGYSIDEMKGKYIWDLFLIPEEIKPIQALVRELQLGRFPNESDNYWVMRDGNRRLISWSNTVLLDSDGSVKYIVSVGIDITERKRTEEIRRALEREQELSELRLRFFALASHEFRTPLSTILLTAQLLESSAHEWSTQKRLRNLRRISSAAKSMTQLLNDILTINRAETGRLEFNPKALALEKFCQDLLEEIQLNADSRYSLNFSIQGKCKNASLDEKLLRLILNNLLTNAIKYSPEGGEVNLALICEQETISFQVHDRGIGIPVSDQPHLFEAFHRGENIVNIPGSGLGLTVVKKCVDLHGGSISVTSEVGVGTTFTVTLPVS